MTAICPRCGNDLTHPTEIRENLCVHCYFDESNAIEADWRELPPSDYLQMDLATQDMMDSRQQTEMAGSR